MWRGPGLSLPPRRGHSGRALRARSVPVHEVQPLDVLPGHLHHVDVLRPVLLLRPVVLRPLLEPVRLDEVRVQGVGHLPVVVVAGPGAVSATSGPLHVPQSRGDGVAGSDLSDEQPLRSLQRGHPSLQDLDLPHLPLLLVVPHPVVLGGLPELVEGGVRHHLDGPLHPHHSWRPSQARGRG